MTIGINSRLSTILDGKEGVRVETDERPILVKGVLRKRSEKFVIHIVMEIGDELDNGGVVILDSGSIS